MEFQKIYFGGDYNPDQWPEETWFEDIKLMKEAGVNLVSLGIFSWVKLEPRPGEFSFAWLDKLMNLLHENGISVDLATPTAAPPAWMVTLHPDMLPVNAEGVRLWHGSRRHYCPHHPDYRRYATRVAQKLADRYKDHPALAMWHIDNEYGCHISECYCEYSAAAFRQWLKDRYSTLERLNFAWGTAFWGQSYMDWEEIQPPRKAPAQINPTQQLDWARFSSDSWLACFTEQKNIIRQITPHIPITTNFMTFHKGVDYFKFAQYEDVVANDSYPDTWLPDGPAQAAIACDLMRSLGAGRPWMLMEQAASQVNWRPINVPKRPGVMRAGSLQAVARGANGILFFQWRQSKAGAEKHHSGMLPHAGAETRVFREVKALGSELKSLTPLLFSRVKAQAAIVMDWNNWWALELDSKPSADLKLIPQLYSYYKALFDRNICVDFVHPEGDLSAYRLIIAPNLYLVSDQGVENINRYVEQGGTLLMSFFSGIVDENEHIRLGGYPAPFIKTLGLSIEEYVAYPQGYENRVETTAGDQFRNTLWADVVQLHGAETLAVYKQDYFAGGPAVTRNNYGKGSAYYLGGELEPAGLNWLLNTVCLQAGVKPVVDNIPAGVEAVQREDGSRAWLFLINHTGEKQTAPLPQPGFDLVTRRLAVESIDLEPNGVCILQFD